MSSFGRGRGIIPSLSLNSPTLVDYKNGINSNHIYKKPIVSKVTSPVIKSPQPIILKSDFSKTPDLNTFRETLMSLKDEDSLFPLILDIINSSKCTIDSVELMVKILIDCCMWNPVISKKYSALLTFMTTHKVFGKEIRCFTFNALQMFYEDRESLRLSKKYGDCTFRNAVILTGEVYYRYRLGNCRYKILCTPLLNYLTMLAESRDEEDLQTLAQQMCWSGDEIAKTDENSMTNLMIDIRTSLITQDSIYTEKSRAFLLLCAELCSHPFDQFSEPVRAFYCDKLGDETINLIKPPSLELDNHVEYYNAIRKFFS